MMGVATPSTNRASPILKSEKKNEQHGHHRQSGWPRRLDQSGARVWLRIALLSFGGPAGQIAMMHRILIDEKNGCPKVGSFTPSITARCFPGPKGNSSRPISAGVGATMSLHPIGKNIPSTNGAAVPNVTRTR
jgi:hypothetical protein